MKRWIAPLVVFSLVLTLSVALSSSHTATDPYITDLVAGQTTDAGDVLVWNDEANLYIKYVTAGGWCITETHLDVAASLGDIPQTKKGNPKPGRFTYKDSFDPCVLEASYTVPVDWEPNTELYIAAHAVVQNGSKGGEGAWAAGFAFPWKSWATYFKYLLEGALGDSPSIEIEKLTNGEDADTSPGLTILVGQTVTWTYNVTNTGNVQLTSVTVTDDQGVTVTCPKTTLEPGESMTCTATGTAVSGQYANVGTATGTPVTGPAVTDDDPSHYLGIQEGPAITIKKYTNGEDADAPPGPTIPVGQGVTWTYNVTNAGNVPLTTVTVTDDQGVAVTCPKTALEPGEAMTCTATGTAASGQYVNVGTVTGTPATGPAVTDDDPSHYFGGEEEPVTTESIVASPSVLWPPNHKMVPVTVTVTFTGSGTETPVCQITSVASNEPENGLGDGDTSPDWEITGPLTVNLRAERGEDGNGRVYTITVECVDASNNMVQGTTEVIVPRNKKNKK